MHEYALAEAVVETVKQELAKLDTEHLASVTIALGELQNVNEEVFFEGLKTFLEDGPWDETLFHTVIEPASFACSVCGFEWDLTAFPHLSEEEREAIHFLPETAHVYIYCPSCHSRDFHVEKGRGVHIQTIEVLKEKT
jgi:hydrogenase nickel incorporation protein HypA/HybF